MTCIAALVDENDTVWMGGDSASVAGLELTIETRPKVFRRGPLLIGFTYSWRMGQLLEHALTVPDVPSGEDLHGWACTSLVDAMRECFTTGGWLSTTDGRESQGEFLVGVAGRLFTIQSDWAVLEAADGFTACGCGESYALGALYALDAQKADMKPRKMLDTALSAAERHSGAVRGPFTVLNLVRP